MFLVWSRVGRWFEFDTREGILDPGSDEQVQKAAENGDVNELRRLRELGRQLTAQTCAGSAENGNLECLQYLHENGCQWDERTCAYAARYGNLECLTYAHENGCPWDTMTCAGAALNACSTLTRTAARGMRRLVLTPLSLEFCNACGMRTIMAARGMRECLNARLKIEISKSCNLREIMDWKAKVTSDLHRADNCEGQT